MNTSLRRISLAVMALIVLLLFNATLTQVFTADGLRSDPRNQRVLMDEYSRQRGQITAGGQLLAYSVATDSRFRFLRVYPNAPVYAPVTGFYSLRYSSSGLERAEDPLLNGSDQRLFGRRLADFFTGRDPRGGTVDTTISPRIQQAGWDAMQQGCNGPCRGAVVALEPSTGKILAMVSAPSFDANQLASHDPEQQAKTWQQLRDDPHSPLVNRAISQTYPPGSTFKVITTAAALQNGATEDDELTAAASIPLPDSTASLENYGDQPCVAAETVTLREAFARSCNTAFVQLGLLTGTDAVRSTAQSFGLDVVPEATPLQVAESTVGPISDAAALGMSSIGQKDVALTPLENAVVAATIANAGVAMQPYLVDGLQGPDLANISTTTPHQQRRAVSPQVAAKLTELMVGAENVTQQKGAIPGVQIASKTGTAEHGTDPRHTPPHAWYIAFAPAKAPKVAVAVLVEDGADRLSATGGALAAPIGRAVIEAALQVYFREHAALSAFENNGGRDFDIGALTSVSDAGFDAMAPVLWPHRLGDLQPQARFFADGGFYANDRKARFVAPEIPALRTETSAGRPLRLNTGRVRDQWHTMTRTGSSPRLCQHLPEPFVEIHPSDAVKFAVADGGFARVVTDYGQCILKVVVSERQQRGMLFAPIHWNDENSSAARVGALVAPFTDPFSGQPENKATPVSIQPYEYVFRGFALSRAPLQLPPHAWWARVAVSGGQGYLLADNADLAGWQSWLRTVAGADLAEYRDAGGGVYRAASFNEDRIESCLFMGPARDAGDWNAVKTLFAADKLSDDQRRMLLSGKSTDGLASAGPVVCACFGVGRTTICDAIAAGANTAAEIGAKLKAGTNCGSCIPELKRLIAQAEPADQPRKLAVAASP